MNRAVSIGFRFLLAAFAVAYLEGQSTSGILPERAVLANSIGATTKQVVPEYVNLPLSFEPNQGQTDRKVQFLARGNGYTFFSSSSQAVLSLRENAHSRHTVRLELVGSRPVQGVGQEPFAGRSNYFIGKDPRNWHTNVPQYAKVRYKAVYPGVDVIYYGRQGKIENDFVLAPGTDVKLIAFVCEGAEKLTIDAKRNLLLHVGNGKITLQKPLAYEIWGNARREVAADYILGANGKVGFRLGAYNHQRAVVIDPVLLYSTYLGGSKFDSAFGIAVDSSGNAYVAGQTSSVNFPVTSGVFQHNFVAGTKDDVFVSKLSADGSKLLYSTYLGGSTDQLGFPLGDIATGIAVDAAGNAYVTGETFSTGFPTTAGAFQTHCAEGSFGIGGCQGNAFVTKLNSTGSALVYSTYIGGTGNPDFGSLGDRANAIALDSTGHAYIVGATPSNDFPRTAGAFSHGGVCFRGECSFAFLTKLSSDGTKLVYSSVFGGNGGATASSVKVDSTGHAFVTGTASGTGFATTPDAFQTTDCSTLQAAFVTKFRFDGSGLLYSTYLGGCTSFDNATAIAIDGNGNAYVTGSVTPSHLVSTSTDFPITAGAFQRTCTLIQTNTSEDCAFVSKLRPDGSGLLYSTYLGGSVENQGNAIAVDRLGNAFVTGFTRSSNFPVTSNKLRGFGGGTCLLQNGHTAPCADAFVTNLNSTGSAIAYYSTFLGGSNDDFANAIALDSKGNAYVAGQTASSNFPFRSGSFQTLYHGGIDAFISKLVVAADLSTTISPSTNPVAHGSNLTYSVAVSNKGPDGSDGDKLTDATPPGTTFVAVTTTNGTCSAPAVGGTGTVTCKRNSRLLPGHSWGPLNLTVKVTAVSGSTITNTATVSSTTQDLNTANNTAKVGVKVN